MKKKNITELKAQELKVAKLKVNGYKNHKIADILGYTEKTVKKHLSDIYRKLECGKNKDKMPCMILCIKYKEEINGL